MYIYIFPLTNWREGKGLFCCCCFKLEKQKMKDAYLKFYFDLVILCYYPH